MSTEDQPRSGRAASSGTQEKIREDLFSGSRTQRVCFLERNRMTLLPHPSYSPDLAPCDFFSLPKNEERAEGAEI
uniref:Tc1-like transposase DDE domain-containing protein n=1 Tax=Salarias fasciatus TaxID=181472 RepID=A0A672G3S0_SALFA